MFIETNREVIIQYGADAVLTDEQNFGFNSDKLKVNDTLDMTKVYAIHVMGGGCYLRTQYVKVEDIKEYYDQVILDVIPIKRKISQTDREHAERLLAWNHYLRTGEM